MNNELIQASSAYKKLFILINDIDSINTNDWTIMHSLAYILSKYKLMFGIDYILSFNESPSKCYEYKLCSRIWAMNKSGAGEGQKVKDYIDWFYNNYKGKKPFKSVGAVAKAENVLKFVEEKRNNAIITMMTKLDDKYLDIIKTFNKFSYITNYGELLYLRKAYLSNNIDNDIGLLLEQLSNNGFDINQLDNI